MTRRRIAQVLPIRRSINATVPHGILNLDEWLDAYATIRKNQQSGGIFEVNALGAVPNPLPKNNVLFTDVFGRKPFIPDGQSFDQATGTYRFVEVKNYSASVLGPSGNAGKQLDFLLDTLSTPGSRHQFDLMIGPNTELTATMVDLLQRADRSERIVVRIFRGSDSAGNSFSDVTNTIL